MRVFVNIFKQMARKNNAGSLINKKWMEWVGEELYHMTTLLIKDSYLSKYVFKFSTSTNPLPKSCPTK